MLIQPRSLMYIRMRRYLKEHDLDKPEIEDLFEFIVKHKIWLQ